MHRSACLLAGMCVSAFAAAATPRAPVASTATPPAPQIAAQPDTTPAHIARLNLPPPAQARGPVEAIVPVIPDAPQTPPDGIQRCAGADGTAVFTDRRCEDVGAVASAAPAAGNAARVFVRSCARSREALVDGLRDALETQDANRVASYYHWTGMGTRAAYSLMDRLQGFSERPLMDIRLVTSEELVPQAPDRIASLGWYPMLPQDLDPPPPPRPRAPDLVRVDQMRSYDNAGAEVTYLHLLANAGCWWVRF